MLSPSGLDHFIESSLSYLARACGPDGRFVYRINLDPNVRARRKYNILRHAGSMYALGLYGQETESREADFALLRAGSFLHEQIAAPVDWDETLAVWSRPEVEGRDGEALEAKLGGTGLGLVGLLCAERVLPGFTPLPAFQALGRFLVRMQRHDGSFISLYVPAAGGPVSDWVSLYYPGEAALGLLMLHQHDPVPAWLDSATRCLLYLARSRQGQAVVEPDHWALLATALWLRITGPAADPATRDLLLSHVAQVARSMMARVPDWPAGSFFAGSVVPDGRTCPTATQMEGLVAAFECLAGTSYAPLLSEIRRHIEAGFGYLMRCQIPEGPAQGGMPRSACRLPLVCAEAVGNFNQRATEIRIDYVQHAACAFLSWRRLGHSRGLAAA